MLGQQWFYYRTFRKVIAAFGAVFNDIQYAKYDYANNKQLGIATIPLTYEGKETWLTRLQADPELTRGTQIPLPAMTYEWKTVRYAKERKQTGFLKGQFAQSNNTATQYKLGIPIDMGFELNLFARNIEDGAQVAEQIVSMMAPQYTVKLKYLVSGNVFVSENLPIILQEFNKDSEYEGPQGTIRMVTWTFLFNVQTFLYGPQPVTNVIKSVSIDFFSEMPGTANANAPVAIITSNVNPITANSTDTWNANTIIVETA